LSVLVLVLDLHGPSALDTLVFLAALGSNTSKFGTTCENEVVTIVKHKEKHKISHLQYQGECTH
jgi:hypothetical protein